MQLLFLHDNATQIIPGYPNLRIFFCPNTLTPAYTGLGVFWWRDFSTNEASSTSTLLLHYLTMGALTKVINKKVGIFFVNQMKILCYCIYKRTPEMYT